MALINWLLNLAHNIVVEYSSRGNGETEHDDLTDGKVGDELKMQEKVGFDEGGFRMPLHYPRYKKAEYEKMEEWKLDLLLREYGLNFEGSLDEKRSFAMGAFLWPDQYF